MPNKCAVLNDSENKLSALQVARNLCATRWVKVVKSFDVS